MRILSLNTWKSEGKYDARLIRMAAELEKLQPTVVLLQECFICDETGDHTARFLADRLSMNFVSTESRRKFRKRRGEDRLTASGLAILAKGEISSSRELPLPSSKIGGERVSLISKVQTPEGQCMRVCCSHFSHIHDEVLIRSEQIRISLRELLLGAGKDFALIGGDFNCIAKAKEVSEAFCGLQRASINALDELACNQPTSPLPPREGRESRQIDQLWLLPGEERSVELISGGVVMNEPVGDPAMYPSDHAAVYVDLRFKAS